MTPYLWQKNVDLAKYTTLKVGGRAEFLTEVRSVSELIETVRLAREYIMPITVIGGGSNVLVSDDGVRGVVVVMGIRGREILEESTSQVLVSFCAGEILDEVVTWTIRKGWWGIENLSFIPGTIGATPVQNVGAYGVEIADVIELVTVYDCQKRELRDLTPAQCEFSYRHSVFKTFKNNRLIVVRVVLRLQKTPNPILTYADLKTLQGAPAVTQAEIRACVCKVRSGKFPDWTRVGTAGSFFKNPLIPIDHYQKLLAMYPNMPHYKIDEENVKVPLGWVLDHVCGLRGYMNGCVGTYEKQALVIVQNGGATASEIDAFSKYIQKVVYQKTGVKIVEEVTRLPYLEA